MLFWLQIAAAVTDLVAATLWFRSAAAKAPSDDLDGGARLQDFLNGAARLNGCVAARVTALGALGR
jgi:hypothetical protein